MHARRWTITTGTALFVVIVLCCAASFAANSVFVESKVVNPGETGVTLGVYLENDVALSVASVPLEFRAVNSGAYIAANLNVTAQGRVTTSGLMDVPILQYYATPAAQSCSGPVSNTYQTIAPIDYVSPDALLWAGVKIVGSCLTPGSDGGTPTLLLTFDVTSVPGTFVIDTCCAVPNNHLSFYDCAGSTLIAPAFTPGAVYILGASGPDLVSVESKTASAGETGVTVGVFIDNSVPVEAAQIPFEFRSLDPGAYITSNLSLTVQGRIGASRLMDLPILQYHGLTTTQTCSGPVSHSFASPSPIDFVSPDCALWAGISIGSYLPAGFDGGTPSLLFTFDVGNTTGSFIIDTCCTVPAVNIAFVDWNTHNPFTPDFIAGEIEIIDNQCPTITGFDSDPVVVSVGDAAVNVAHATDPEGDDIEYYLVDGPGTVNPATGEWIYFTSCLDADQLIPVTIGATDRGQGACDEQAFELIVTRDVLIPFCTDLTVACGDVATQTITAVGGCPAPYLFAILSGPGTIGPSTGLWVYNTSCAQTGLFTVEVGVSDGFEEVLCTFDVNVTSGCIVVGPTPSSVTAGETVNAIVRPSDIGAHCEIVGGPGAMIDDTTYQFMTTIDEIGHQVVTVQCVSGSDTAECTFEFDVVGTGLLVERLSGLFGRSGQTFLSGIAAISNPPNGPIVHELVSGPGWVFGDQWSWLPTNADLGEHSVTIRVYDNSDTAYRSFDVEVINDFPYLHGSYEDTMWVALGDLYERSFRVFDLEDDPVMLQIVGFQGPTSPSTLPTVMPPGNVIRWNPIEADTGVWMMALGTSDPINTGAPPDTSYTWIGVNSPYAPTPTVVSDTSIVTPTGITVAMDITGTELEIPLPDSLGGGMTHVYLTGLMSVQIGDNGGGTAARFGDCRLNGTSWLATSGGAVYHSGSILIGPDTLEQPWGSYDTLSGNLSIQGTGFMTYPGLGIDPSFTFSEQDNIDAIVPLPIDISLTGAFFNPSDLLNGGFAGTLTLGTPINTPLLGAVGKQALPNTETVTPAKTPHDGLWPKLELRVRVIIVSNATTLAAAKAKITRADKLWGNKAGINIKATYKQINAAGYLDITYAERQELHRTHNKNCAIEVYFVDTLRPGTDRGLYGGSGTEDGYGFIANSADNETVAHELGHALGLPDVDSTDSGRSGRDLMVSGSVNRDKIRYNDMKEARKFSKLRDECKYVKPQHDGIIP